MNAGHESPIEVVIADDAIERLTGQALAAGWRDALVVMDVNTSAAVGARVVRELRAVGVNIDELVFAERSGLLASPDAAARVRARVSGGSGGAVLAVGSGVITDLVRYAVHQADRDFVSVPSAASMDGYASSMAAMQIDGVKVTVPARAPSAIFADPRVAAAAPPELTRAGIGDLLGKATARVDWLAAHLLYGEPFSESIADSVLEPLSHAAANARALLAGEPAAIRGLLDGLIQSGIAMAMAGSSRPASGCEHHASHFWDLLAAHGRRPHAAHGLQVGYATQFAMRLGRYAFAGGVPDLAPPVAPADPLGADARTWLGEPSADIVAAVEEKQRLLAAPPAAWPADPHAWDAVRAALAPSLERFAAVRDALTLVGIPAEAGFLDVDAQTLRATFHYATRLRARYTVIDFLEGQRALESALDETLGELP